MDFKGLIRDWLGVGESKSSNAWIGQGGFLGGIMTGDPVSIASSDITPGKSIQYYKSSAPVATGVDMLADAMSSIDPVLWDERKSEYVSRHDYLTFLRAPNPMQTWGEFVRDATVQDTVTANVYILLKGMRDRPPVAMEVLSAEHLDAMCGSSPQPDSYMYSPGGSGSMSFVGERDTRTGMVRYFFGQMHELIPIHGPNPNRSTSYPYGVTILKAAYSEIEQLITANLHNTGLLRAGARPGGMLTADQDVAISDDQRRELRDNFAAAYGGAGRSGRVPFLPPGIKFQSELINNRDMDWASLQRQLTSIVFSRLKIPLPLVSAENMTLSNYDTARLVFYDQSVLPAAKRILSVLQRRMAHRWKGMDGLTLTLDPASITALDTRSYANLSTLSKTGVLTVNELRANVGYESIDGGDELLRPSTLVPIGQDRYTDDNRDTPAKTKARWAELMGRQVEGKKLDVDMDELWDRIHGQR